MKKPIRIKDIEKMSKFRPIGYKEEVLNSGEVIDDMLWIEWGDYKKLLEKYSPNARSTVNKSKPCSSCGQSPKGLGSAIEKIAKPIAKMIDKVVGTDIQNCGGCKKRKEKLDQLFPFK
jgi:hypothetical protein